MNTAKKKDDDQLVPEVVDVLSAGSDSEGEIIESDSESDLTD
jgi:hypothetical protein